MRIECADIRILVTVIVIIMHKECVHTCARANLYMGVCVCACVCLHVYMYIYIEREIDRKRDEHKHKYVFLQIYSIFSCICIDAKRVVICTYRCEDMRYSM